MERIKKFIKMNMDAYLFKGVVIGISGGIDSAVVGKLLVDSMGKDKVYGLILPERDTDSNTIDDAKLVCRFLDIEYEMIDITGILRKLGVYSLKPPAFPFPKIIQKIYSKNIWEKEDNPFIQDLTTQGDEKFLESLAYYRTKPRIRSTVLYFEAEKRNYAVAGCTNKTEYVTGFYTKWGDEVCDIEPIRHLYKTEVFELAKELNIPKKIIDKKPSPDIAPGITDEFAIGMDYAELDRILMKIEGGKDLSLENEENVKKLRKCWNLVNLGKQNNYIYHRYFS
ncbi:NAD(+) synthase [Schnuerera ultunensis]|uniref:NH(3)-dependent NAD(+) synthetase n=1 Tax=[Clostridium] ultunense Esp TaxID=1288971 RepID=A0A1M4PMN3_9FIRM|nr:NAD(+) synthase [Schnuerera ultunensis]SHD76687.1 NH(3)-dependent NAD(+) synthetase [[Clostridium] ultunense Esp]